MFYGVFIAEEVDGVGKNGSVDTTTVDVKTLGGLFEHVPKMCLIH
jgi:hypothetical protein